MTHDVIDAFLEYQEDLAAHIGAHLQRVLVVRPRKAEFDVARRKDITSKAPHPLRKIVKLITLRIDCPDDVTHRVNQLARSRRDHRKAIVYGRAARLVTSHFAQHRNARETSAYVIMQVRSNARAHPFQLQQTSDSIAIEPIKNESKRDRR